MAIDALIFDFDRVIMDAETPEIQTWQEVFRTREIDFGMFFEGNCREP
ncbi:MAG: hypothetical protein IIB29_14490 [Chloroflexi bacterium]|nr:hypothetical protein [Chloroflexota bacterium]MCI0798029.1 hypothetical protein [Chloroflexota bacterium]